MDITSMEEYGRMVKGHQSESKGNEGEDRAREFLTRLGFAEIRKARGKWTVVRWQRRPAKGQNGIGEVVPDKEQKLHGDWFGIWPLTGQSCRFEVKTYSGKLQYSAVKSHQIEGLEKHAAVNGLSFLVWVDDLKVYLMRWPIIGFKKNTSLNETTAETAHRYTLKELGLERFIERGAVPLDTGQLRPSTISNIKPRAEGAVIAKSCPHCGSFDVEDVPLGGNMWLNCHECDLAYKLESVKA